MLETLFAAKRVLVLGAHPDEELGCGGTISKLVKRGIKVYHYYFSTCVESLQDLGLPEDMLIEECNACRRILGIDPAKCGHFDFPVRRFPEHRQAILDTMLMLKKQINPALVMVPNGHDIHQDHNVIYKEALRAFKHASLLGFEMPWNTLTMDHDCLVEIDKDDLDRKISAVACYKSQAGRNYANIEFFQSLAKVRGVQGNMPYAECYEVVRLYL